MGTAGGRREAGRVPDKIGPTSTFVEVKSPGWENEVAKAEGQTSPRLQRPKYLHGEVVATAVVSSSGPHRPQFDTVVIPQTSAPRTLGP